MISVKPGRACVSTSVTFTARSLLKSVTASSTAFLDWQVQNVNYYFERHRLFCFRLFLEPTRPHAVVRTRSVAVLVALLRYWTDKASPLCLVDVIESSALREEDVAIIGVPPCTRWRKVALSTRSIFHPVFALRYKGSERVSVGGASSDSFAAPAGVSDVAAEVVGEAKLSADSCADEAFGSDSGWSAGIGYTEKSPRSRFASAVSVVDQGDLISLAAIRVSNQHRLYVKRLC